MVKGKERSIALECDMNMLSQTPIGHVLGASRLALLITPCCNRRIRVTIQRDADRWCLKWCSYKCPSCHSLWQLKARFTRYGYISCIKFKPSKSFHIRPRKLPKKKPELR